MPKKPIQEPIGALLRALRKENGLGLAEVANAMDIDIAILSKMERGERNISRETLLKLSHLYRANEKVLLIHFLSEKVLHQIWNEDYGKEALKLAVQQINFHSIKK